MPLRLCCRMPALALQPWRRWVALALLILAGATAADPVAPWLETNGQPGALARQGLDLLADAASHGLQPADYGVTALRQALAEQLARPTPEAAWALSHALDAAMRRYLGDLQRGRVDPRRLQQDFELRRRPAFDVDGLLAEALASGRLDDAVRRAAPGLRQYQQLREALARYRRLQDHAAWQQPLPALPAGPPGKAPRLDPGQPYAGLDRLAQRLIAVGDLAADTLLPARYEGPLVDALRAFQRRHGLVVDGVIGAATLAALQVAPADRARQIGLALERLRWTPLLQGPRMVVINVPEFVLRAYEVVDGRIVVRETMKVIVGKSLDTRTPLFDEDLRFIEFSPYWNVPASIARNETVPRLRRDPGYFDREGFEFVTPDGRALTLLTAERIDALRAGALRIRQRPGPKNALGDIKFVFPNRQHIFLHHTPALALFERQRRDFSHGCIRVEQPVALARFVLQGQSDAAHWSDQRIQALMSAGRSSTLRLDAPVPVLIAYGTALVKSGRIHFFDDLYGQDRLLDDALRRARPSLP